MKQENLHKLIDVITKVRSTFQDLKTLTNAMHADLGLTAATRAVLEHLADHGENTVPRIAQAKNVTRQHIQQLVDALVVDGLASFVENPDHKRSQLVRATEHGYTVFGTARRREMKILAKIAATFDAEELDCTLTTLTALSDGLACEKIAGLDG